MNGTPPPLFGLPRIVADLRGKLGDWNLRGFLTTALVVLMFGRVSRILAEMERLARGFQAGTLRRMGPLVVKAGGRTRAVVGEEGAAKRAPAERIWPARFGWLVRAVGWEAAGYGSQLRAILEQPETRAFLQACPQAVRTLRPLCRMLSIESSALRPWVVVPAKVPVDADAVKPKRVRTPRPKPEPFRVPIPRGVMGWVRRERRSKRG